MVGKYQMLISFLLPSLNEQYQHLVTDWKILGVFFDGGRAHPGIQNLELG